MNTSDLHTRAPIARDEEARISTLHAYEILDTDPEPHFDEAVNLVADVCNAPVALLVFLDRDRQWFKAKRGTDLVETGRDVSVCAHAIQGEDLFIVRDTADDARCRENRMLLQAGLRFYAGMPLITPVGQRLGTLCVLDVVPRDLTDVQKQVLEATAKWVVAMLEVRRMSRRLVEQAEENRVLEGKIRELRSTIAA